MIAFAVNVYRDEHLADRLIRQLADHYRDASHIIIPDSPRLKDKPTGQWTQRYLEWALATGADVIIKLDPDTCVWRRAVLPDADWFGTISTDGTFVRGGACGFRRETAKRLVESRLLLEEAPFSYARYGEYRWPHEEWSDELISCQDRIVGRAMAKLQIPPAPWPDVLILGNGNIIPEPENFAMTHPHPQ